MAEYALITPSKQIIRYEDMNNPPELANGKPKWVPVEYVGVQSYDPKYQKFEGPVVTVSNNKVTKTYTVRDLNEEEMEILRLEKDKEISDEFYIRVKQPIPYTVNGVEYLFDADDEAITNLIGVAMLVIAGLAVPNPRPWSPHKSLTPVFLTHDDILGIGKAIADRKDYYFVKKKQKQAELAACTTPQQLAYFDALSGW